MQRAVNYSTNLSIVGIPLKYHPDPTPDQSTCIVWNILDTCIYALIPFVIIFTSSIIIIVQVCRRRRSTMTLGGLHHRASDSIAHHDQLSTLLISINVLFLMMTGPFNILIVGQSILNHCSESPNSPYLLIANQCLQLLQNSYHALSFIFYCFIGNKFRSSAKLICRRVYYELFQFGIGHRCAELFLCVCCVDRRHSSTSGPTMSTTSRQSNNDINRRLIQDPRTNCSYQLNVIRRTTYVTFVVNPKSIQLPKTSF